MKRCLWVLILILFTIPRFVSAQMLDEKKSITLDGYVKYMNTIMDPPDYMLPFLGMQEGAWVNESMFHNRLNFRWYASNSLTAAVEVRNRFIYGDFVESFPGYADMIERDMGYFNDLTNNLIENEAYLFNTSIDRLWVNYRKGKFEARIGRQRINWGQAYVWNPNDIFNAYSFFDFDYEERPGSDAIRLQYFPSFTSAAELAVKIDENERITVAGYYRFNQWNYDIQVLGGILNEEDYVAGLGWSGNIKGAGVNGEITYLHPTKDSDAENPVILTSLSANYMFDNSLYIQAEGYYNGYFQYMNTNAFSDLYYQSMSVKTLSFSKFSWFGQASYPIHPLLNGTLALMYYPDVDGFFLNPSLKYSLSNNIQLSAHAQFFNGKFGGTTKEKINFLFFRFKWSF